MSTPHGGANRAASRRVSIRNILIPVDFSHHAELAAQVGVALARRLGVSARLLYAVEVTSSIDVDPEDQEHFEASVTSWSEDAMNRLVGQLDDDDVELSGTVERGAVNPTLLAAATSPPASLIVIGSSGRSEAEPLHLGSVTARLIREAPCPVLVLRASHAKRLPKDGAFHRPLVTIDYSQFSEVAVRCASVMAVPDAPIELYHAVFIPRFELFPSGDIDKMFAGAFELAKQKEDDRLTALAKRSGVDNPIVTTVEAGRAAELINRHVDNAAIDVVVTGAHGRQTSTDLVIGSVADRLLRSSSAPVLFIPDAVAREEGP